MVKQCFVCHKVDYLNPDLSFHRFPRNRNITQMWLSTLRMQVPIECLPKEPYICSSHFRDTDFEFKGKQRRRFLKKGVVPICPILNVDIKVESSSDSTIEENSPKKLQVSSNLNILASTQIKDFMSDSVPGPSLHRSSSGSSLTASSVDVQLQGQDESDPLEIASFLSTSSKSSTVTASETEMEMREDVAVTSPALRKRKRCTAGNLSISDFSTPRKAQKNFKIMKTKLCRQQKKIRLLQQSVRRLKARVTTLTSLVSVLKEKCLITENAETSVMIK